jgi:hypothetical protein
VSAVVACGFINCISEVFSMSIARSVLFVLSVASTPPSPLASLDVDAAQHAEHAAGSQSVFVEAVRQATERFRDVRKTKRDPVNLSRQNVNILPRSGGRA